MIRLPGIARVVLGIVLAASSGTRAHAQTAKVDFARDVKPILEEHCTKCHGPEKQKGGVRLDIKKAVLFDDGILVAGKPDKSKLFTVLIATDEDDRMPKDKPPLLPAQIAILKAWIEAGVDWPDSGGTGATSKLHWSYVKPKKPDLPVVKDPRGIGNPIDAFVAARLEKSGLSLSPPAVREILIRRVYLDLIGLPPAPADIDAFLRDRGPKAFDTVVDRLLGSPQYGERWARLWLDLARFADTNGFEQDNLRSMWPYRDWVVRAFNRDLPFDRFTIEQIAGDMLPGATVDQQIASGFHANTMLNEEGGVDPGEARFEVMVDRVNTTGAVWLGSTFACAQCHNHKYDPFSARDYYRFMAFFENGVTVSGRRSGNGMPMKDPELRLPDAVQAVALKQIEGEIEEQNKIISADTPDLAAAETVWVAEKKALLDSLRVMDGTRNRADGGARFTRRADGALLVSGNNPGNDVYEIVGRAPVAKINVVRIEVLPDPSLPEKGPGRAPNGQFMLSRFRVFAAPAGNPAGKVAVELTDPIDTVGNRTAPVKGVLDEDPETGWAPADNPGTAHVAMFKTRSPIGFPGGTILTFELEEKTLHPQHGIGCFRILVGANPEATTLLQLPRPIRALIPKTAAQRGTDGGRELTRHFRGVTPLLEKPRAAIRELEKKIKDMNVPRTLVMQEKPGFERPSSFVRDRGAFVSPTERVFANTPSILPALPDQLPANRLGLAQWLVSKDNPLTARVLMNRIWETYFGRGIVSTLEDFGSRGDPPTHPELLDFLATELMDRGWSLKAMHKLIVTSATYRQSAKVTPDRLEKDPYNELLSRGPRFRVEAEMVRDIALAASGLLSRKMGGPSVMPPQPEGVWEVPQFSQHMSWVDATGEDRFRRALYTFMRRSSPYPMTVTFDGTAREVCTLRRIRTNTPLQALNLLNDPAFVEMARGLAERIAREAGADPRSRLERGFRLVTGRKPGEREVRRLLALLTDERKRFRVRSDGADARALLAQTKAGSFGDDATRRLGAPEDAAAWTLVGNALLNLDEMQTKE